MSDSQLTAQRFAEICDRTCDETAAPQTYVFSGGTTAVVVSLHPALVAPVRELLQYELRPTATPEQTVWRVHVGISRGMWTPDVADAPRWEPVLDRGRLGFIGAAGARTVVADWRSRSLTVCDVAARSVRIVSSSFRDAVHPVMTAIRHLITVEWVRSGGFAVHASAVKIGRRVMCFIGPKGAGKTTALSRALLSPGVSFLSNDMTLLRVDETGSVVAMCWPTAVGFGRATLASVAGRVGPLTPELHHAAGGASLLLDSETLVSSGDTRENLDESTKVWLLPGEVHRLFGCAIVGEGRVEYLVDVALDHNAGSSDVRALSTSEMERLLISNAGEEFVRRTDWAYGTNLESLNSEHLSENYKAVADQVAGIRFSGGAGFEQPLRQLLVG